MISALPLRELSSQINRQVSRGFARQHHARDDAQFRAVVADDRYFIAPCQPDELFVRIDIDACAERVEDDGRFGQLASVGHHRAPEIAVPA